MSATPPPSSVPPVRTPIDVRLVQWFAAELILDSRARLVEGGAGGDTHIDLAQVFVDLPVVAWCGRDASPNERQVVRSICQEPARRNDESSPQAVQMRGGDRMLPRALIVGGPGSGKTTVTTMISQLLRLEQVGAQLDEVPAPLQARVREVARGIYELHPHVGIVRRDLLPLRVNLPELSRWMASRDEEDPGQRLWRFLASRAIEHAGTCGVTLELPATDLEELVRSHDSVVWIFDGLDEVPRSAGRDRVVAVIHAAAPRGRAQGMVVTTRPQGYEGEFGDLDSLVLTEMPQGLAHDYGRRLLRAWSGIEDPQLNERLKSLNNEFTKTEVQALVRTPLHATMATLLVAEQGTLPNARYMLFEHYFDIIFKRELGKKGDHGVRLEDKQLLRTLHARAGLVLHTRSQDRAGARPTLSPRELGAILEAIFGEEGRSAEDAQAIAERMLRLAADRLVLLLRVTDGGYAFGIRSLQEFFAGVALLDGETAQVKRRLEAIALNPHWSNVLGLIVSGLAVSGAGTTAKTAALEYTRGLCRTLNDGTVGGRSAAACVAGSRLAIAMLRETERYGNPWLHDPLWELALDAANSPAQAGSARDAWIAPLWLQSRSAQWDDDLEIHVRLGSLAVRWQGANRDKWLQRVLESARALLKGNKEPLSAGWLLLVVALQRGEPRAVRIANENAPETPESARRLLKITFDWGGGKGVPWALNFANEHPSWFPPGWLRSRRPPISTSWPDFDVFSPWRLDSTADDSLWLSVSLGGGIECLLRSLDMATAMWSRVTFPIVTDSAKWQAWHKLAAFHAEPSKDHLADALEAIAASDAWDVSRWRSFPTAWPVCDCLNFVADATELTSLAASVRAGQLGDLEDWRAAEARWRANRTSSDDEIVNWLSARGLPWTHTIATLGRIFSFDIVRRIGVNNKPFLREISQVCAVLWNDRHYHRRPVAWLRYMLRGKIQTDPTSLTWDLVQREIVERAPNRPDIFPYDALFAVDFLLPDLSGPSADGWYRLFDERGRQGWNRCLLTRGVDEEHRTRLMEILGALLARLSARPDQWGLVDTIWAVLNSVPTGSLAGLIQPALPPDATARARASAAAVSLLASEDTVVDMAALLLELVSEQEQFDLRLQLATILARRDDNPARATSVLLQMLDATTDTDEELRDVILAGLFQHLKRSSPTAFSTADAWREHHLHEPYLSGQAPEALPPRIINLVELSNIRLFKDTPTVDAPFSIPEPDQGQWIVLVGENGVGKTTLLRALGLALADPTVATRLLDENQPFVRNGGDGRIAIELDTGQVEIIVRRDVRTEVIVPAGNDKVTRPWVIGYGVRRGNARGEKDRAPEWGPTGELHTLFDRPATLVNAVDWLLDLDRRVLNERRQYGPEPDDDGPRLHAATWQSVERALKALLHVTAIEPEERHVMVTHPEFGRVRLDALSDGYLTTTGWVIDLMARWIQRQEDLREVVGRDLLRQMTGIVLIDEIDLHLHPIWQMHIIDDVRRLFPRLSFVVTTHNPLTLQGARPGEIFIMRRGDGGRIELTQRDIRPGHDVDRVLFEQFGIVYTFDKETRALLEKHRELLERGTASTEAERASLESKLAARLGRVGEVLTEERGGEHDPSRPWSEEDRRLLDRYAKGRD